MCIGTVCFVGGVSTRRGGTGPFSKGIISLQFRTLFYTTRALPALFYCTFHCTACLQTRTVKRTYAAMGERQRVGTVRGAEFMAIYSNL